MICTTDSSKLTILPLYNRISYASKKSYKILLAQKYKRTKFLDLGKKGEYYDILPVNIMWYPTSVRYLNTTKAKLLF